MHSLPLASKQEKPGVMNKAACRSLAERLVAMRTLRQAGRELRDFGLTLPPTTEWYSYLTELGINLMAGVPSLKLFSLKGNTKLPFASWSSLPFLTCPGMWDCEEFCYSPRAWRYPGGFARQLQNTLLLKHKPELIADAFYSLPSTVTAIKSRTVVGVKRVRKQVGTRKVWITRNIYEVVREQRPLVLRLYVDGDFGSVGDVHFWMRLLRSRPEIEAYGYSKSWEELWAWGLENTWPTNYVLNLSSGGREQKVTLDMMRTLPITRNEFLAIPYHYRTGKRGRAGFERYDDPKYHAAIRASAKAMGMPKAFSCPGKCGECSPHGHVCGSHRFDNVVVVNGVH